MSQTFFNLKITIKCIIYSTQIIHLAPRINIWSRNPEISSLIDPYPICTTVKALLS